MVVVNKQLIYDRRVGGNTNLSARLHDSSNSLKLWFAVGSHVVPNRQARVSKGINDRQTE